LNWAYVNLKQEAENSRVFMETILTGNGTKNNSEETVIINN